MARIVNAAAVLAHRLLETEEDGWIGVDLDGTLAKYNGWKGLTHIGEPVPKMVARVRRWVGRGKKVKIFTARADDEKSVNAIKKWLKKHDLPDLEVTNLKDKDMIELWDDRAVAVKKNTGEVKEGEDPKDFVRRHAPRLSDQFMTSDGYKLFLKRDRQAWVSAGDDLEFEDAAGWPVDMWGNPLEGKHL